MDFLTHTDLTGRLRGLVIMLDEKLTTDQSRNVEELIDASEFAAALETLADWLSDSKTPIPDDLRNDFDRLANQVGNRDRVTDALRLCPREA